MDFSVLESALFPHEQLPGVWLGDSKSLKLLFHGLTVKVY